LGNHYHQKAGAQSGGIYAGVQGVITSEVQSREQGSLYSYRNIGVTGVMEASFRERVLGEIAGVEGRLL
jgi:hypothetical protein